MTKQQKQTNECGRRCGAKVNRRFLMGHDAELLCQSITRYVNGDSSAMREAKSLGWTAKLQRSIASRKSKAERRAAKQAAKAATPEDEANHQVGELRGCHSGSSGSILAPECR